MHSRDAAGYGSKRLRKDCRDNVGKGHPPAGTGDNLQGPGVRGTTEAPVLPSSTVTQAARSSFRPGALGARLGTTHAIASMRTDKDSG